MFSRTKIIIALIIVFMPRSRIEGVLHPTNTIQEAMKCDEFSRTARFNPYSVIGDVWMAFYYWAPHTSQMKFMFSYPNPRERAYLFDLLQDKYVTVPVNWTARYVVMEDKRTQEASLLVEKGDRGQYWLYTFSKVLEEGKKYEPIDVRLKQTGDNKYIAIMHCQRETVYVMARITEIPPKAKIQDAAACIGYRGRGGKSYLYQGHEWMPIDEDDEDEYWNREAHTKKYEEEIQMAHEELKWHQSQKKKSKKDAEEDDHKVEKNILG